GGGGAAARESLPRRAAGVRAERGGARRAEGARRRALRRPLGARAPAAPVRPRRAPLRAVRARNAGRGASGHARRRAPRREAAAPRPPALRSVPRRRGRSPGDGLSLLPLELPVQRLRPDAALPSRAYAGDAGLDLSACERVELAPGERALVPTGLAVAIPEGFAGFVQPRSGLA